MVEEILINNESKVKEIHFKSGQTNATVDKNTETKVTLTPSSRMEFIFYSKDSQNKKKPATYTYFKIENPSEHVKIEINKVNNSKELKTVIEWPKNVKQRSPAEPAENVEVGVKE
ncbi:MAG: hypothetical protein PVH61_37930 [Candidatus Aminicenantes bacterium]|jgi:hypothetical protein